jgi:hypothetical protein
LKKVAEVPKKEYDIGSSGRAAGLAAGGARFRGVAGLGRGGAARGPGLEGMLELSSDG